MKEKKYNYILYFELWNIDCGGEDCVVKISMIMSVIRTTAENKTHTPKKSASAWELEYETARWWNSPFWKYFDTNILKFLALHFKWLVLKLLMIQFFLTHVNWEIGKQNKNGNKGTYLIIWFHFRVNGTSECWWWMKC